MFGFSYTEGGPWNDDGIKSIAKFTDRVERLVTKSLEYKAENGNDAMNSEEKLLNFAKHSATFNCLIYRV